MVLSILTVLTAVWALYFTTKATEFRLNGEQNIGEDFSHVAWVLWVILAAELCVMVARLL